MPPWLRRPPVLSYQIDRFVSDGRLQLLLHDYESASIPVSMVYGQGGKMPVKLRSFIDVAAQRLRRSLMGADPGGAAAVASCVRGP